MKLNKKNKYLIGGILAMAFACYFLAVKKTFELKGEMAVTNDHQEKYVNVNHELAKLSKKEQNLDLQLSSLDLDNSSVQNNLLRILNEQSEAYGIKIIAFNAPHVTQHNNTKVKTQIFTLEGSYVSILKMLHELEKKGGFGRVSHVDYEKNRDFRNRTSRLQTTIFLKEVK
ncbi:hypothetical protein [Flagellimonas algicola]|uniref:Uncharacterized protein n=1 Tax=Flagellimonas algicola TaxID=2583815 RepID=A0ABY2WLR5_9FLAO|nr:hypothetical protein [Allomuricauda algicola]TMU55668.1 hypothetical protein FGG15_16005 [Allomuricauda algicola]